MDIQEQLIGLCRDMIGDVLNRAWDQIGGWCA